MWTGYTKWDDGKGSVGNALNQQKLSLDAADHNFKLHKDKGFKSLVKQQPGAAPLKKIKPNDACTCGSGKKYKKCCGAH